MPFKSQIYQPLNPLESSEEPSRLTRLTKHTNQCPCFEIHQHEFLQKDKYNSVIEAVHLRNLQIEKLMP